MPLNTGKIVGDRYRIVKLVGQGGFGAVYRAWHLHLNMPCALKENLDVSEQAQRQFAREASVLASLRHPNLPRVVDYFSVDGQGQYLVMDYIEGETLEDKVAQHGPVSVEQAVAWISQICDALAYLHSQEPPIIHRDVKPGNITITPEGQAMLIDFGAFKVYAPHLKTTVAARVVSPGYAPVEQYGMAATDARTDVYAVGATLYHILSGQEPPESIARLTGTPLPDLGSLNGHLDSRLVKTVESAMGIMQDQRLPTVVALKGALQPSSVPLATSVPPSSALKSDSFAQTNSNLGATPTQQQALSEIEWVEIPAGKFLYGENYKPYIIERPFKIGKYPVTNAQYKRFLDANHQYPIPKDWDSKRRTYPPDKANHPVVHVSWHEAVAFCQWAKCRLPTEHEWEKAVRGTDGRIYPWGKEWVSGKFCNSSAYDASDTTPVNLFSDGVSPYGVWDMSGNVWEWTSSSEENYMTSLGGHKVLRGGSWLNFASYVRAVSSITFTPWKSDYNVGFRCAQD